MSGFHEVSLPLSLAFGARGGPERRTEVTTLGSGRETRNATWALARRRFEVGGATLSLDEAHALIAFFEARRGRLHGFRFRDVTDWRSGPPSQAPTPLDQALDPLDATRTRYQLVKRYGDAARPIRKPIAGSVRVAVGGAELAANAVSVDATSGIVTLLQAAPQGAAVTAGFAFDTPVRFDADRLEASLDGFGAARIVSAPLIELLF